MEGPTTTIARNYRIIVHFHNNLPAFYSYFSSRSMNTPRWPAHASTRFSAKTKLNELSLWREELCVVIWCERCVHVRRCFYDRPKRVLSHVSDETLCGHIISSIGCFTRKPKLKPIHRLGHPPGRHFILASKACEVSHKQQCFFKLRDKKCGHGVSFWNWVNTRWDRCNPLRMYQETLSRKCHGVQNTFAFVRVEK